MKERAEETWWQVRKPLGQVRPILCGPCKRASDARKSPWNRDQYPTDLITGIGCQCFACGKVAGQ